MGYQRRQNAAKFAVLMRFVTQRFLTVLGNFLTKRLKLVLSCVSARLSLAAMFRTGRKVSRC